MATMDNNTQGKRGTWVDKCIRIILPLGEEVNGQLRAACTLQSALDLGGEQAATAGTLLHQSAEI